MISDKAWKQLEKALLLNKHSRAGAPASMSDRDFLEAVIYLARTGCPWGDLPESMGYWHAVYMRFRRWQERGVWQRLWKVLQKESFASARLVFIDSTAIRAHPHAAGAQKKGARPVSWPLSGWISHKNTLRLRERKLRRESHSDAGTGSRRAAV